MKNLNWKNLCCTMACGLLALAGTAGFANAQAQTIEAAVGNQNRDRNSIVTEEQETGKAVLGSSRFVRRAPPPVPGGGCQANGDFSDVAGAFPFIGINPATFMRADNFRPAGTGPVSLTSVSWTGLSTSGAAPNIVAGTPPASFQITIFNDFNGFPGTTIGATQTVTPTAVASTETVLLVGAPAAIAYTDYVVTLPSAVALTGGTCYWIEIRPTTAPVAGTGYNWRTSAQGDGVNYRRTATGTPYANTGIRSGDLSFCTNLPLISQADGATACAINSTMTCAATSQVGCQIFDGSGQANFSTQAPLIGGTVLFRSADNFSLNAASTISAGCFQGVYALQTGQTLPAAGLDSFQISVFQDAGSPTSGVPGTLVASRLVTPTDGALVRGVPTTSAFANSFSWSFDLSTHSGGSIALPSAGCYWIEVVSTNTTFRWAWLIKSNARAVGLADDFRQTQASTVNGGNYDLLSQQFSGDFVWCLTSSSPLVRSTTCGQVPAQPNQSCGTAITLTLGAAPLFGHNLIEVPPTNAIPFDCVSLVPNANGLWYRVVGNGQDISISTCNSGSNPLAAATNFDTVISVYCTRGTGATECTGGFVCIGTNDDTPAPGCSAADGASSTITFPTVAGQVYYAYVYGFEAGNGVIDTGFFYVNATASGTPSDPPAVSCANLNNCVIDIPAGSVVEADVCGATSTNSDCDDLGVTALPLGSFGTGRISNDGATRDFDFWRLPDVNDPSGGQWFRVDLRSEFPGFIQIGRGTCTAGVVPLIQLGFNACSSANDFLVFVPNGEFYINLSVTSFNNFPCFAGDVGNRYWIRVTAGVEVGACCIPATACLVTARSGAVAGGTEPGDCESQGGVFLGNGTVCGPNNAPCDPAGGAPAGAIVGSCCLPFAECAVTTDTTCIGGTFLAAGVCTPNACAPAGTTCCFSTGTCLLTQDAAACTTAGGTAQAIFRACTPNACPVAPTGGCCSAAFACSVTTQAACVGTYLGDNVVCNTTNCTPPPAGVCCRGSTCNASITQAACTTTGTQWGAAFTNSSATCNAAMVATAPCCFADYDKTAGIQTGDIFAFLNDWFASSPFATVGGDGVATPQTADIFAFLNAWFAGGC